MQSFSPFRSRATFKPKSECPDIDVYHCPACGKCYQAMGYGEHSPPSCCGGTAERLVSVSEAETPAGFEITYSIVGGLNDDAVQVFWRCPEGVAPAWIMLKTFTGSYTRYLTPKKEAPMTFAMADEDAYVYCDKKVCECCTFRCKRGFVLYVCFFRPEPLLLEVSMDKLSPRFRTTV